MKLQRMRWQSTISRSHVGTQNTDHVNRQCLQWALLLPLQVNVKEMRVLLKRSWNAFFEEQSFGGSIHWSPLSWRHQHLRHKQQQQCLLLLLWCDTENNESYPRRGLLESIITMAIDWRRFWSIARDMRMVKDRSTNVMESWSLILQWIQHFL